MESLLEQAKKKIAFQQITEKKTNIALDKELSMSYTENMTEQKKDTARGREVMKDPTNRRKTLRSLCEAIKFRLVSLVQTSIESPPKKRNYEVVAVIPVELFTPNNRMDFRECLKEKYEPNGNSRISDHIKDFSAYEYEIYVPENGESETCKAIFNKIIDDNWNIDVDIMVALPHAPKSRKGNQEADMYINTGATIVIVILVEPEEEKNFDKKENKENLAEFLKKLGDLINNGINNCNSKKMKEIHIKNNEQCVENGKDWLINRIYKEFFCEFYNEIDKEQNENIKKPKSFEKKQEEKQNRSWKKSKKVDEEQTEQDNDDAQSKLLDADSILRLHDEIEVNYVFTFFICKGFDFYIIPQVNQTDDNIKYSGDAWFLETNKIYKYNKKNIYISEYAYNNLSNCEKIKYAQQENHSWLIIKLIPEAEIRPKDLYYIPKINGGGYNDYSSILLRHINRLCCFIKTKYVSCEEADDKNRIIGMQIIINSFWHRMVEFSRIMRAMCLNYRKKSQSKSKHNKEKKETKGDGKKSQKSSETYRMYSMDSDVESDFENQIYTTPTSAEQIIDINSTDQDVLTLSDLANYHSISNAKDYFNEQKEIYLKVRADEMQRDREKKANKANQRIQISVLILALITVPIGIIEIVTADISSQAKTLAIVLIGMLSLIGVIYFIEPVNNFFSKLFQKLFRKSTQLDNEEEK